jgi:hypothetical protein
MDRSPPIADYMSELSEEARRADFAAIVVGYDEQTRFVWSTGEDPATRLKVLLRAGGKAVAILGADIIGNAFIYRLNPFPAYQDDAAARRYLAAVGAKVADILEQRVTATLN